MGKTENNGPGRISAEEGLIIAREAENALFSGNLAGAVEKILERGDASNPECMAVLALIAILDGRRDDALKIYEDGLKALRKREGRRKVSFGTLCGAFYPILLIAAGELKKAYDAISAGEDLSPVPRVYAILRYVADRRSGKTAMPVTRFLRPEECERPTKNFLTYYFYALCIIWTEPEKLEEYKSGLLIALEFLDENPAFTLFSRELGEILGAPVKSRMAARAPLNGLLDVREGWKTTLAALDSLIRESGKKGSGEKRLAWKISWITGGDGVIEQLFFSPVEQRLQPSGKWTGGRPVAFKRLKGELVKEEWITRQDAAAAAAARETGGYDGWYYKKWFEVDEAKMIKALAGHPYVVRDDDGTPVEILAESPGVGVETGPDGLSLKITPHPSTSPLEGVLAVDEGHDRIRIWAFTKKQLEIASLLGKRGLTVPPGGRDEALKTLEALSPLIPVSSELSEVGDAPEVPSDNRIYVQLAPVGEGFSAAFTVRPLGPAGPAFRPGSGGRTVFGTMDGRRVRTVRDHDGEAAAAEEVRELCPALAEAEQTDDYRWILDTADLCLDFLLQAEELGDRAAILWPAGRPLKIRARAGFQSVKGAVRSSRDWFVLTGEIAVDEKTVISLKEACRLLSEGSGRYIPLGNGEFLALTEELRKSIADLAVAGDWRSDGLRFSPLSSSLVGGLALEAGDFSGDEEWHKKVEILRRADSLNPEVPALFRGELRDYQEEGFRWMMRLASWGAGACLADDMGLGKTLQALAVLLARAPEGPALVVAPLSVVPNWVSEAARFTPSLSFKEFRNCDRKKLMEELGPFDVVVASYGLLRNEEDLLESVEWQTAVLDEAQAIKNSGAKRSAAAMKIRAGFKFITTGTPVENNLGELWNLFRFINPGLLGSKEGFNKKFAAPIEKYGDKAAAAGLKKLIRPFLLRRTKDQVLSELPPKTEIVLRVEMTKEERSVYEAVRRRAAERIETGDAGSDQRFLVLAELMRLRRACCSPSLVLPEKRAESTSKLEALGEILDDLTSAGRRCLVFSQFVDHLAIIARYLEERGVSYSYLDGATSSEERKRQVATFQSGEKDCFLISLRAGGTGLNLTAADFVVHMDPWWNPAVEDQASDRAHRIGQERPVTVYRIVARDTVEEKIVDLHGTKRDLAESLLEGAERAASLSFEEMTALIREGGRP